MIKYHITLHGHSFSEILFEKLKLRGSEERKKHSFLLFTALQPNDHFEQSSANFLPSHCFFAFDRDPLILWQTATFQSSLESFGLKKCEDLYGSLPFCNSLKASRGERVGTRKLCCRYYFQLLNSKHHIAGFIALVTESVNDF